MTLTVSAIIGACTGASQRQIDALADKLNKPIFVLNEDSRIIDMRVIDVLNEFSENVPTPTGIGPKFFYADGALQQWQNDCAKVVERLAPIDGFSKLIDFALADLDNNGSVSWAWDRADLEAVLQEQ